MNNVVCIIIRMETKGAYYWCHAVGKQKRKWEIDCIIGHVWCKRTVS